MSKHFNIKTIFYNYRLKFENTGFNVTLFSAIYIVANPIKKPFVRLYAENRTYNFYLN